uniref:BTB domain-containing protein n=1 Tax=Caenorhabditis tropicalis TaxID=1561998 RepID=A0A1I7T928_9PELO
MGNFKVRRHKSGHRNKNGPKGAAPPANSPTAATSSSAMKNEPEESKPEENPVEEAPVAVEEEKAPEEPPAVSPEDLEEDLTPPPSPPAEIIEDISEISESDPPEEDEYKQDDPVTLEETTETDGRPVDEKKGEELKEEEEKAVEKVEEVEIQKKEEEEAMVVEEEEISDESDEESDDESTIPEPEVFTDFTWEKRDEDVNVRQTIFVEGYHRKFAVVRRVIDPEFRFAAEIGPCKTFDAEGVQGILEKFKEEGFEKPWPFDDDFKATPEEMHKFLFEVLNQTKFVLRLACAERGYEYMNGKQLIHPISAVWGDGIDPIAELKTIKSIIDEAKSAISKQFVEGQEGRFWPELLLILDVVLPALEAFDSKILNENSITDTLATIHGRVELGYEVTEEEVDTMLENSFQEDGFGEFPPTALYAPSVFKTVKQLKLIHAQLEKMSKVTDIRVKLAGIQTITRILELISEEETNDLMEDLKDSPRVPIEKMFGFVPASLDVGQKRVQYLKIFYTALAESSPKEEFIFPSSKLVAALKCFYLVFSANEVNTTIFRILGSIHPTDSDRQMLIETLFALPDPLKLRLQIGKAYETGEVTEDTESWYFLVKQIIRNGNPDMISQLAKVLKASEPERLISTEKALRVAMKCVETSTNQKMAVEMLKILNRPSIAKFDFSKAFFEDLIVLALSKYSVPEEKTPDKKYEFIETVFNILNKVKQTRDVTIDESRIVEKWTNMGHPWFSVLYLSQCFPLLQFPVPVATLPWQSADNWTDEQQKEVDMKNYVPLAKVPTAWPKCTDLNMIEALVLKHVPQTIPRHELYKAMREYAAEFNISEKWKKDLLEAFDRKINFLKPKRERKISKKEEKERKKSRDVEKERKRDEKEHLRRKEEDSKEEEKKEGKKEEKKEEEKKEDSKEEVKKEEKKAEKKEEKEDKENDQKTKEESPAAPEEFKTEEESETIQEMENSEAKTTEITPPEDPKAPEAAKKNEKKPLKDLDVNCFYGFYPEADWKSFEEKIRKEIKRQRDLYGYSNQLE